MAKQLDFIIKLFASKGGDLKIVGWKISKKKQIWPNAEWKEKIGAD